MKSVTSVLSVPHDLTLISHLTLTYSSPVQKQSPEVFCEKGLLKNLSFSVSVVDFEHGPFCWERIL